ncbi:hypothetical protein [Methylomarinum vadi]|uniref:hypothetical protein n=1 Tax=Methylomarinum vadi TaxID=438855 RepID=UPI0004DF9B88|nr:hypothetical protein [Methylomarinum vadi]
MKEQDKAPLQAALYGLDGRSYKTMVMFLQGPCRGAAVVVEPIDADVDIIDADHTTAKTIFEERREASPERPIIAMSLENLKLDNTIFVKKPVSRDGLLAALDQAKKLIDQSARKSSNKYTEQAISKTTSRQETSETRTGAAKTEQIPPKNIDEEERKKITKHKTAKQFSEGGFSSYIGFVPDIDFDDKEQVLTASYNPKNYFQGYVKSAIGVAMSKARVVKLNSGWKTLLIFPHGHEVWLDADDMQLRAFAGLPINNASGSAISLSPVDIKNSQTNVAMDKFQSMEAFLWKLAIWTSKGRYPSSLDIEQPIYLKKWPNMTRLVVTPHALRISALLIRGPRTMLNIAEVLGIKPQYVFVFVSACQALDLLGQAKRTDDQLVAPAEITATLKSGLFKKILNKLRASKSAE